jgi:prenyltransferase beta subunit
MKKSMSNIIILLLIMVMPSISGQVRQGNVIKKIQAKKVAFFNEKLQLTPQESDKFWPVYNDYSNRKNLINQQRNSLMAYYIQNENYLNDKELTETLEKILDFQRKETALMENYTDKFRQFLSDSKVIKIFVTELQFRKYLLTQSIQPRPNAR